MMIIIKNKIVFIGALLFALFVGVSNVKAQMMLDAGTIYRQAKVKNISFLNRISRYNGLIDKTNSNGDTAFCMALKFNDKETAKMLYVHGASSRHNCVERLKMTQQRYNKMPSRAVKPVATSTPALSSGTNYWLLGLGGVAAAGGVAIAAGSGGGGGGSDSNKGKEPQKPVGDDNTGGNDNTGGDDNTGGGNDNTGGDDNTGGGNDNTGGGDDNTGGGDNTGGDDNTGGGDDNTGGGNDNTGGGDDNTGGDETPKLLDTVASDFETDEYIKGNFLDSINAAKAYTYIYKKDEKGNLISHQAGSDEKLEKVKVGVLDSGVYSNAELKDKISDNYDINVYNELENVRVAVRGETSYFVLENKGKYYLLPVKNLNLKIVGNGDEVFGSKAELISALNGYGLTWDDFSVVNNGGGHPGISGTLTDSYTTWWNYLNDLSHGTHVSGIITANKDNKGMHGVAFENAEIVAGSWDLDQGIYATVKDMVDSGVEVFNNSWGDAVSENKNATNTDWMRDYDEDTLFAYAYAAKNKAVWVQATGNQGTKEPVVQNSMGGLNYLSDYGYDGPQKYEVPYLAVASLDPSTAIADRAPSGLIASYSNRCGSAQNWCIAAPGTEVVSPDASKDGYMVMNGTSMATPVVSGSIALLKGYYPWLNAQNIAYILLETANDEGEYADASIYGQGALDLGAAVSTPIGDLGLPQGQNLDNVISARGSKLYASSVMQNKLLKSMPKTITAYDALKRPFKYDTKKLIDTTHSTSANLKNAVSRLALGDSGKKVIKDEKTGFAFSSVEGLDSKGNKHLTTAEVVRETEDGATRFYYAENSKYMDVDEALVNSSNPYFNMREAYGAENTMNLSDSSRLKLSLQAGENGLYERDEDLDKHSFDERSYAMGAEYSFNLTDYLELSTLGGMLFEEDAMLGLNGVGGLGLSDSSTYYMGVKAKLDLTSNISLLLAYYRGYTSGSDSALMSISDLETESFMIASEYSFNQNDKIGLMLSSPMSVVKGSSSMLYSTGRDNNSNRAYLSKLKTSLRPEAKEYDLGIYFKSKPQENLALSGKFETRFNAGGEKGLVDYMGVVGAQYSF